MFTSWSFGLNGIPWIVSAEIFPGALRNFSGTFAALCQWAVQFAMTKALPYIFTSFGYGTWFFFASWMLLASAWAFFMLPETKGLTLAQMDTILYVKPTFSPFSPHKHFRSRRANFTFLFIADTTARATAVFPTPPLQPNSRSRITTSPWPRTAKLWMQITPSPCKTWD